MSGGCRKFLGGCPNDRLLVSFSLACCLHKLEHFFQFGARTSCSLISSTSPRVLVDNITHPQNQPSISFNMLCSKYISFCFLLLTLFLHAVNCADPLYHFCFSKENYTANSPYGTNLNGLLKFLSTKVPLKGFWLSSTGQGQAQANGLALC